MKRMMKIKWALIAIVMIVAGGVAQADPISLSLSDLAGFGMLSSTDPSTITINNGIIPAGTAVTLTTIFAPPQTGLQSADVGLAGLNIPFLAGDTFLLHLMNTNENPWTFQAFVVSTAGVFSSGALSLVPGVGADFIVGLGGVPGNITSVFFRISGNVPYPDGDRTSEYQISPVPEPSMLLLLGSAFALLGLWRRFHPQH